MPRRRKRSRELIQFIEFIEEVSNFAPSESDVGYRVTGRVDVCLTR